MNVILRELDQGRNTKCVEGGQPVTIYARAICLQHQVGTAPCMIGI